MDISLALGGGGAKGNAHIGVLRQLERRGFRVRAIAGTSIGGVVGAIYAAGFSIDDLEERFARVDQRRLYRRRRQDNASLYGLGGVEQWLTETLGNCTFADLKLPFAVVAVDLLSARQVILSEGLVREALLAAIALPAIFTPLRLDGMELVDGGLFDPVPVTTARSLAPELPVAAVVLANPVGAPTHLPVRNFGWPIPRPFMEQLGRLPLSQAAGIFLRSLDVSDRMLTDLRLRTERPEVIIRPEVTDIGLLDIVDVRSVARRGEAAVDAVLPDLQRAVAWPNRLRRSLRGVLR